MQLDTLQRAIVTAAVALAAMLALRWVGAPELVGHIAGGLMLGLSHSAAGAWTTWRTRAVPLGTHDFATDAHGWLELERLDGGEPATLVGLALPETTWDRLVIAADSAAMNAGVTTPGLMCGLRMGGRQVIAGGPWPKDSTLFVDVEALDGTGPEQLIDSMAAELRGVRLRLPLWGSVAAGISAAVAYEILSAGGLV